MNVKAVIDTNVLVSAFLTKNPDSPTFRIAKAILDDRFTLVYSTAILDEYVEVLGRDYLKLPPARVETLIAHIRLSGKEVTPTDSDARFPDPDDKVFFCTATADGEDTSLLVTGNARHFPSVDFVVSPSAFCELLGI